MLTPRGDAPLFVGGVKANIGHAEPAAGMTGLLKLALGLRWGEAAANAQLRVLNPHLGGAVDGMSGALPVQLTALGVGTVGRGGVSSFGYSGTIAHAVLSDEGIAQRTDLPWLLLIYNRRIFPWRDVHHTRRANTARYATCWAASAVRLSETTASQPRMLVLTSGVGLPFLPVSSAPEGEWQSGVLMLAGSWSIAPSLQGTQVALALTQQVAGLLGAQCVLMLTSGTQVASADAAHAASDAAHGGVWGLARVLRLEHAGVRIHSADVSRGPSATTSLSALITGPEAATETEMACCPRGSCAARLRSCCAVDMRADVVVSGRYAITGGLGGLGLRAAALVATCGVRRVLLASRSGRVARDGQGLLSQLQSLSMRAEVVACDNAAASDTTALARCGNHVTGLLHAAGSGDEGLSVYLVALRLRLMYAPKAFGAWHLHAALTVLPLECRVLFSSVGAGLSNIGQANYAAANACLDADALSMRSCGVVVCSLQWPLIGGAGMGAALLAAAGKRQASTAGLTGISLEEYAACLRGQLSHPRGITLGVQVVHRLDVRMLVPDLADVSQPRFNELVSEAEGCTGTATTPAVAAQVAESALARTLKTVAPAQRREHVEATILRVVHELAGTPDNALSAETPLMEAGVDSLAATELSSRLQLLVGMPLSSTLIFEQPTTRAVAVHLLEKVVGVEGAVVKADPSGVSTGSAAAALTGMLGRWPGGPCEEAARSQLQQACGDALGAVPALRWTLEAALEVHLLTATQLQCVQHGGCVTGAQRFDSQAFSISPAEVSVMDPQQRLLLELGYSALHASSHRRAVLMGGDAGVFLGMERPDWAIAQPPLARGSVYAITGDNASVAAGRLSFMLGLQGPCATIDTACASALVAVHAGSSAVRGGECERALGLAVSLKLVPHATIGAASAGMLSADGRCKTLDARANGYARSEGVGSLVLRPCGEAQQAVVRLGGSAVRQDGRSASLTAPNGSAQRTLLQAALRCASLVPAEVGCAEAHGTGTALGDPTEAGSLAAVHGTTGRSAQLAMGAAKASVGHSEAVSGQVGLLKVQGVLRDRAASGNPQLRVVNRLIHERLGTVSCQFVVPTQGVGGLMRQPEQRVDGGVSSFGYSGTIAHAVLSDEGIAQRTDLPWLLLVYNRRIFQWRDLPHPFAQRRLPSSDGGPTVFSPLPAVSMDQLVQLVGESSFASEINPTVPIRDMGMDSLAAASLAGALSKLMGIDGAGQLSSLGLDLLQLSLNELHRLLSTPTLQLTGITEQPLHLNTERRSPSVERLHVPRQQADLGAHIICMHTLVGHSVVFTGLLHRVLVNWGQSVYGMLHDPDGGLETFGELAEKHADALMLTGKAFDLLGVSNGTGLCNATAHALARRGGSVFHLVLIDPAPPLVPEGVVEPMPFRAVQAIIFAMHATGTLEKVNLNELRSSPTDDGAYEYMVAQLPHVRLPYLIRICRSSRSLLYAEAAFYKGWEQIQPFFGAGGEPAIFLVLSSEVAQDRSPLYYSRDFDVARQRNRFGPVALELEVGGPHLEGTAACVAGELPAVNASVERFLNLHNPHTPSPV